MKELAKVLKVKTDRAVVRGAEGARKILCRKAQGASHFVEILVAIIIVIAIGLVFKTQIANFVTTIVTNATTKAQELF